MEGRRVLLCVAMLTSLLAVAGPSLANPGVDAGGPYQAYEGTSVTFTATTDDPSQIFWQWDFNNDNHSDTAWRLSLTMSDSISVFYCDDHHGYIAVDAWDGMSTKTIIIDGQPVVVPDSERDTARVDIYNALPTLDRGGPYLGSPGVPITFQAIGRDPGCDDLTFIWLWGDGSSDVETYNWTPYQTEVLDQRNHTYVDEGTHTVTLLLLDDDGGFAEERFNVFIRSGIDDIDDLIDYTQGLPVPGGTKKGLLAQLHAARGCLLHDHDLPAVRILTVFAHRVKVLERKGALTYEQAGFMTASVHDIIHDISS